MRVFLPHHNREDNQQPTKSSNRSNTNASNKSNVHSSCQDSKRKQSQFEFVDERKIAAKKKKKRRVATNDNSEPSSPKRSMGGGGKLFPVRNDRELLEVRQDRGGVSESFGDSNSFAVAARRGHDNDDNDDDSSSEDDSVGRDEMRRQIPRSRHDDADEGRFQKNHLDRPDETDDDESPKVISVSFQQGKMSSSDHERVPQSSATATHDDPATIDKHDTMRTRIDAAIQPYALLLRTQHAPPLEITPMAGDGNCLFRAVALQVYGSEDMHATVRSQCLDFMEKEEEHFRDFVAESYAEYIRRKRCDGVHGNHAEIQAMSELYNRKIEVFVPPQLAPMNIFQQDDHKKDCHEDEEDGASGGNNNPPIRLLYMDGNHYDALVDPLVPTAGLGLGLPGLQPGLADRMQVDRAKEESHRILQDNMERKMKLAIEESKRVYDEKEEGDMERVLRESCLGVVGGVIGVSNDGGGGAYRTEREEVEEAFQKKALYLSEMEAADFDLEQAVLASSLESYRKAEQERKQPSLTSGRRGDTGGRRGRYNCSPNGGLSRNHRSFSSSPVHRTAAAASSTAEPISYAASFSASPSYYPSSYPYSTATATSAAASSVASFPRARSSSPPNNYEETHYGANAAASSLASTHSSSDEYPSSVQELVMNGFELSKVLHAYDLIGDNFDDLLSFLLSSTS
ncbi:hypothetical protein ACHAW6_004603 [Cyclotella cf. meneghiniana]